MDNSRLNPSLNPFNLLPPEIVAMIFVFLPPKILCICKCVCKSWKDIIESANFIEDHAKMMKLNDHRLFFTGDERGSPSLSYRKTPLGSLHNERIIERGEVNKQILACCESLILYGTRYDRFF